MVKKKAISFMKFNLFSCLLPVFVSRPTGLRASYVTQRSVRVDWNPALEKFIVGYRVFVQNIPFNETLPWNKNSARVAGLSSNTRYIISVVPVHGLSDEEHPAENSASIIVTTKREQGTK